MPPTSATPTDWPIRERAFLDDMHDRGVDGIVIALAGAQHNVDVPDQPQTPIVCIGSALDHPSADLVAADDEVGSRAAVAHLIGRGAKRIAMIQGSADPGRARDHGYRQALADAGIAFESELMELGDWTRAGRPGSDAEADDAAAAARCSLLRQRSHRDRGDGCRPGTLFVDPA